MVGQRRAQVVDAAVRVTVQRQCAQALPQFRLQRSGQAMWVFHRVELDHADRVLNRVGMDGLDILANQFI